MDEGRVAPAGPDAEPAWRERVQGDLVAWYDRGHRRLPWRDTADPYRVLVSEVMLVQTTVAAVVPFYERFLERFPTVEHLAEAPEVEVLRLWEGLGYYRRARQLQAAARAIVEHHGGRVPDDVATLQTLPGVGRYIAGAVVSLAFDRPAPILEANSQRVLARLIAWEGDLAAKGTRDRLWLAATRLVPTTAPGRFNQALMELGATVCLPSGPRCLLCPLRESCRALARGLEGRLPMKALKAPPLEVTEECALVERDGAWLMLRRAPGGLWAGFWEFPTIHLAGADPACRSFGGPVDLAEGVFRLTGVHARIGGPSRTIRYSVTKHRVTLTARPGEGPTGDTVPGPNHDRAEWVTPEALATYPMGAPTRKLLQRPR